jgi:hypothetical protein
MFSTTGFKSVDQDDFNKTVHVTKMILFHIYKMACEWVNLVVSKARELRTKNKLITQRCIDGRVSESKHPSIETIDNLVVANIGHFIISPIGYHASGHALGASLKNVNLFHLIIHSHLPPPSLSPVPDLIMSDLGRWGPFPPRDPPRYGLWCTQDKLVLRLNR